MCIVLIAGKTLSDQCSSHDLPLALFHLSSQLHSSRWIPSSLTFSYPVSQLCCTLKTFLACSNIIFWHYLPGQQNLALSCSMYLCDLHTPLSFQFLTKEKESQDLFVSVTEFEKQQPSKMDPFASYKVKTEVRTYIHTYTLHAVPHVTWGFMSGDGCSTLQLTVYLQLLRYP